jgi:hypothetical protein
MAILQNLPFCLSEPGPADVEGVGNFYLEVLAPAPSQLKLSTLYFLDSHGQMPSKHNPDYEPIKESQIRWFIRTSQAQRKTLKKHNNLYLSLAFQHIPLPEFGDGNLTLYTGGRREPTEAPMVNSHFFDTLVREGILAIGCGHDHLNDFCALRTPQGDKIAQPSPWLCYGGGSGFGGYGSYDGKREYRRMRVWELNTATGHLGTWLRVEYSEDRVDEIVLAENGVIA